MIRVSDRIYSFVALLYVFLSLLGYQLATSLFLPLSSDVDTLSISVTHPYRAIVFVVAFFLIITTPQSKAYSANRNLIILYVVFMCVYLFRIMVDIYVRGIYVQPSWQSTVVQYVFIVVLPSLFAMIRCAGHIDLSRLCRWLMWGGMALMVLLVINQNTLISFEYEEMSRGESNVAMGSLNLGYSSSLVFFILFSVLISQKEKWVWKLILILFMIISFVIMLRASSRGPLVCWAFILLFYLFSRIKNKLFAVLVSLLVVLLIWVSISGILSFLGNISPLMERRMTEALVENDSSGRDILFANAIDLFLENPILGKQFVLSDGFYSHNSVLDVMIGLGLFGALIWVFIIVKDFVFSSRNISLVSPLAMISFMSVHFLTESFFSGAIYISAKIVVCLVIVFFCTPPKLHLNS